MKKSPARAVHEAGFTLIEAIIVLAITLILASLAIPGYQSITRYLRIAGDARNLNGIIAQAKIRAAADFTHARAYADLSANTYHLEIWNVKGKGGAGCWQTDGDAANPCTVAGTSPAQPLSTGVTFGFGRAGAGAPNPQAVIAQAPLCGTVAAVSGVANGTNPNTSCIEFNSRGVPIALSGTPTATDALYVTDGNSVYGTTLLASGMMQDWSTPASTTKWQTR
ncbi:MAG TPA: type II secretion system protein [Candidatus Acidoferrum sp.]